MTKTNITHLENPLNGTISLNRSNVLISFVSVLFFMTLFGNLIGAVTGIESIDYIDEVLLLLIIGSVYLTAITKFRANKYLLLISFVGLFFILLSFKTINSNFVKILIQSILHLKFFFYFFFIFIIYKHNQIKLMRVFNLLFILTCLGIFLNLALQARFNSIFHLDENYRFGMLRLEGFQLSSNNLGITLSLIYTYLTFTYFNRSFVQIAKITFLYLVLIIFIGTRIALFAIPIVFLMNTQLLVRKRFLRVLLYIVGCILSILLLVILKDTELAQRTLTNISAVQGSETSGYIRGIMIFNGIKLLVNYFPIGAGAATFGTVLSGESKTYEMLGLSKLAYFQSAGIYDSNWASIAGEFGLIGIIIFMILITYILKFANRFCNVKEMTYIKTVLILLVIYGITAPVFMNGYPALLFAIMLNLKIVNRA